MEPSQTIHTVGLETPAFSLVNSFAQSRGLAVASFSSVEEFLHAYQPGAAGCLVLDLAASGEEGLTPLDQFRRQAVLLPVVAIADQPTVALAVRAMQRGAASVLEKPLTRASLEPALLEALEQERMHRQCRQLQATVVSRLTTLTEGEREVLDRLMSGMANKNIAADLQLGLRTVELRRAKILKKLGARSLAEMVRLVLLADPKSPRHE
jgi:FixJ family two-component response regulator